ncbi:hypothetical protein DID88_005743 [Monilinia fructigena]|uniref:Uncharacterized protein n=1 Tax=Monilinia fructigena TaxID=38457 RepID=A0A395J1W0_9HELO|nr:hypothetical protein DID88_005743 [Monilinia fructigena]
MGLRSSLLGHQNSSRTQNNGVGMYNDYTTGLGLKHAWAGLAFAVISLHHLVYVTTICHSRLFLLHT